LLVRKVIGSIGIPAIDAKQLVGSIINIRIGFDITTAGGVCFWFVAFGKSIEEEIIVEYRTAIGAEDRIKQFFKLIGILMEHKNGVVIVIPSKETDVKYIKLIEGIVESVSMTMDTVFWFFIRRTSSEGKVAEKYFEYLGVTEEEWLLGL
jgi:hypothetical protein